MKFAKTKTLPVVCLVAMSMATGCIEPVEFRPLPGGDAGGTGADIRTPAPGDADVGEKEDDDLGFDPDADPTPRRYYRKKIAITKTDWPRKVPGFVAFLDRADEDLAEFAPTANHFRFVGPGGSPLPHEVVDYSPGTGQIRAWVRLPALNSGMETTFWIEFGPREFPPSSGEVWAGFAGVWHFDGELSPGGEVSDSSPNENHGVIEGLTGSASVPGRAGGAMKFDGVDDLVRVRDHSSLKPSSGITMSAWTRLEVVPAGLINRPATDITAGYGNSYQLVVTPNSELVSSLHLDGTHQTSGGSMVSVGEWHHLVATWDGTTSRLYLDGIEVRGQPLTGSLDYDGHDVFLGSDINVDQDNLEYMQYPVKGVIDEAWLLPSAASPVEVHAWFLNQANPTAFFRWGPREDVSR